MKPCKDCAAAAERMEAGKVQKPYRPAPNPGPRCATHWREELKRRKAVNHERNVQKVYGLSEGDYEALYLFQGGRCYICARATGATRRLAVDHDHATGAVRGLLCRPCNSMLGHARDSSAFFRRALAYLSSPPYSGMKGQS